jgi:hypothetical protein
MLVLSESPRSSFLPALILRSGAAAPSAIVSPAVSPLNIAGTLTVPGYTETIALTLPDNVSTPLSLAIDGTIYLPATNNTVPSDPAGIFLFDPVTQTATVYPARPHAVGSIVTYTALSNSYGGKIPTARVLADIPDLFTIWNVKGIEFDDRLFEFPVCRFTFVIKREREAEAKGYFLPGRLLILYGRTYSVDKFPDFKYSPNSRLIEVTVSCGGSRGDRNPYRRAIVVKESDRILVDSLAGLCAAAGISYDGPYIPLKHPKDLPNDSTTTVDAELERAYQYGRFWDTEPHRLTLKEFGKTPLRHLSDAEILDEGRTFTFAHAGEGALFDGIPLASEYNNIRLTLDRRAGDGESRNEWRDLQEGDPNPQIPPNIDKSALYSPRLAFDAGGPTRSRKSVKTLNGQTVWEKEETFGFVYTSLDTHSVSVTDGNVAIRRKGLDFENFWTLVSSIERLYIRDKEGYLRRISGAGTRKTRFRQESDQLELARIQGEILQTDDTAELNRLNALKDLYLYGDKSVTESRSFTLAPLKSLFPDTPAQSPEPLYVSEDVATVDSYAETPDPDSTDDEPLPPIAVGQLSRSETYTTVVRAKSPEVYRVTTKTSNAEGTSFAQTAAIEQSRTVPGRPQVQTRLQVFEENRDDDGETVDRAYRLTTPGALGIDKNPRSISFTGADTLALARRAAETSISIENSSKIQTTVLRTRRKPNWRSGDRLYWRGITWWILGVSESQSLTPGVVNCSGFTVSLGRLVSVPVAAIEESDADSR